MVSVRLLSTSMYSFWFFNFLTYCCWLKRLPCLQPAMLMLMSLINSFQFQELIDLVAEHHVQDETGGDSFSFLEIGCGSGAICLSLLTEFSKVK